MAHREKNKNAVDEYGYEAMRRASLKRRTFCSKAA